MQSFVSGALPSSQALKCLK